MNPINFKPLVDLLKIGSLSENGREIIIDLQQKNINLSNLESYLKSISYRFNKETTIRDKKLFISLNAADWNGSCLIYKNWNDLFLTVGRINTLPEYFFLAETMQSSLDQTESKDQLELFCHVRELLANLADHCEPSIGITKGSRELFFLIEADQRLVKYRFQPAITWKELQLITTDNNQIAVIKQLIQALETGDGQDSTRRTVMKQAFYELISPCHAQSHIFKTVLTSADQLLKLYEAQDALFVNRFSVNKAIHDINKQDLAYTAKINEILSSAQNKAIIIPVILITMGLLMKIEQYSSAIAVAFGMLVLTLIVDHFLSLQLSAFKHISMQIKAAFKRYDILNEEVETKEKAKKTKSGLLKAVLKSTHYFKFMRKSIWAICIIAIVYLGYSGFKISPFNTHNRSLDQHMDRTPAISSQAFYLKNELQQLIVELKTNNAQQINSSLKNELKTLIVQLQTSNKTQLSTDLKDNLVILINELKNNNKQQTVRIPTSNNNVPITKKQSETIELKDDLQEIVGQLKLQTKLLSKSAATDCDADCLALQKIKLGDTYKVIQSLNLRSGPGINNPIILTLSAKTLVSLRGVKDSWWKIETEQGDIGWLSSLWLRRLSTEVKK